MVALKLCRCLVLLVAAISACTNAYYLPGTYPQEFLPGQSIEAEANSLVSSDNELPYDYYSMPFCKPDSGVKKSLSSVNPGTILTGSRILNSPYNFTVLEDEKTKQVCKPDNFYGPLTDAELADLRSKIDQHYRVRLILDNLPITTYDLEDMPESIRPGYQVGYQEGGKYYVNNHLMFKILIHKTNGQYTRTRKNMAELEAAAIIEGGTRKLLADSSAKASSLGSAVEEQSMYMVVGFEVLACSIKREPGKSPKDISCADPDTGTSITPQEITKGAKVVYTYDTFWELSEITWASRWDAYLRMPGGRVHWFSILNSLMVVLVMSSIVAMIMLRTIRRDLARYEGLLGDTGPKDDLEESGWKMVSGDVFRTPTDAIALCVQVGSGVQIIASATLTLFFAALASRGALLTAMLVSYLLLAVAAGAASIWLWGILNRSYEGWTAVAWRVSAYFPGITLLTMCSLNILIAGTGSSGAIPLGAVFSLVALWFLISIPLCFSGGVIASKKEILGYPTRTNQIPRHIPPPHWASNPLVLFFAAGLLPFGTIFVELYFAMTSIWQGYFYYIFGFCFVVGALTVLITIEVAVVCTYVQLCAEDYTWWWRSFRRGGSVSVYVALYSIGFLFNTLHALSGFVSVALYLSYMGLILWALYLAFGTIGFLSSFFFVFQIFKAIKND